MPTLYDVKKRSEGTFPCGACNCRCNRYIFNQCHLLNIEIYFCRTGKLHLPEDICALAFNLELDYWGIDDIYIEPCCQGNFPGKTEMVLMLLTNRPKNNMAEA